MNFENCHRPLNKRDVSLVSKQTFEFGEGMEVHHPKNTNTFESNIFKDTPAPEVKKITRNVSNTYRASTIFTPPPSEKQEIKASRKRGDSTPISSDIFGPAITRTFSCPVGDVSKTIKSTVFEKDPEKPTPPKAEDKLNFTTHIDAFPNGSCVMRKLKSSTEIRSTATFETSNDLNFARTQYAESGKKKNRSVRIIRPASSVSEFGQIMRGDPIQKEEPTTRESNTFRSQILGSQPRSGNRPESPRKGVWSTNFTSGGCTFSKAEAARIYSDKLTELGGRRLSAKGRSTGPRSPPYEQVTIKSTPAKTTKSSKTTRSTLFEHYNKPTPNFSKKGYGSTTKSTIF